MKRQDYNGWTIYGTRSGSNLMLRSVKARKGAAVIECCYGDPQNPITQTQAVKVVKARIDEAAQAEKVVCP